LSFISSLSKFIIFRPYFLEEGLFKMLNRNSLLLYLCTDRALSAGRSLLEAVAVAAAGGVTMVQIREKEVVSREFYKLALELRVLTRCLGLPLVVNDRVDIALAVRAEGLHLGQTDLPLSIAREIVGRDMFIGVSVGTVEEARVAQRDGADYLGVGAVFPTGSKSDAGEAIGLERLQEICGAVTIPVVGIGGVNVLNAAQMRRAGAAGVAVISAILSQPDIKAAAEALSQAVRDF
jgi:thiamine-phosphate pyrophosphorylase